MEKFNLTSFANADDLARTVAAAWVDEIEKANHASKAHCVALSGGRITKNLFDSVVELNSVRKVSFDGVHFFWADERCVPPTDPESNFKMADDLLFKPLKILGKQIHRIRGEDSAEDVVKLASEEIERVVSNCDGERSRLGCGSTRLASRENANDEASLAARGARALPVLDLIYLGMGEDGHVASLFPDAKSEIVNNPRPFLIVENSPKPPPRRISLSFAAIAAAKEVWVLISGAGKEEALRKSLQLSGETPLTPLGRVIRMRQKTLIFSQIEAEKKI